MTWFHEPAHWNLGHGKLTVAAEPKTDFWQKTHYGYSPDNGHFYYEEHGGDFVATVKISGTFKERYDQAGLMIRIDSLNWIKRTNPDDKALALKTEVAEKARIDSEVTDFRVHSIGSQNTLAAEIRIDEQAVARLGVKPFMFCLETKSLQVRVIRHELPGLEEISLLEVF